MRSSPHPSPRELETLRGALLDGIRLAIPPDWPGLPRVRARAGLGDSGIRVTVSMPLIHNDNPHSMDGAAWGVFARLAERIAAARWGRALPILLEVDRVGEDGAGVDPAGDAVEGAILRDYLRLPRDERLRSTLQGLLEVAASEEEDGAVRWGPEGEGDGLPLLLIYGLPPTEDGEEDAWAPILTDLLALWSRALAYPHPPRLRRLPLKN